MAIDAYEMYNSRRATVSFNKQSANLEFFCRGTLEDVLARAAIIAITPATYIGLLFENLEVEPTGGGVWLGHATYNSTVGPPNEGQGGSSPPPPSPPAPAGTDPLGPGYSFDISGVTEKITQSKETVQSQARFGGNGPDFKGAIGLTADGEVQGCDKVTPRLEFSITKTMGFVTLNYLNTLMGIVGHTNNAVFYGFDIGEVLCVGASGQGKDTLTAECTFKFACSINETGIVISPEIDAVNKKGHEYLWVAYQPSVDQNSFTMIPDQVRVERIYDEADFAGIGIGV